MGVSPKTESDRVTRIALIPAALAGVLALTASATAARSPHDPTLRTVAVDAGVAKTLLITKADVPTGFVDKGVDSSGDTGPACSSYDPDLHRLVETAEVDGHNFERTSGTGYSLVSSGAAVFRSRADAVADWNAIVANAKVTACIRELMVKGFGKLALTGVRIVPVDLKANEMSIRIWELTAAAHENGRSIPLDIVLGFYLEGRAASNLLLVGAGAGFDPHQAELLSARASRRLVLAQSRLK